MGVWIHEVVIWMRKQKASNDTFLTGAGGMAEEDLFEH